MGYRTFRYKMVDGAVVSQCFDSDDIPSGWEDTPAKLNKAEKPVAKKKAVKKKAAKKAVKKG